MQLYTFRPVELGRSRDAKKSACIYVLKCADSDEMEYISSGAPRSVGAVIMSREVIPRVPLYLLAFFLSTFSRVGSYVLPDDCAEFGIGQLEDYLSELHFENVPGIDMMIGGFKCPVTALPFGALKSDWARLLLLQKAQPEESIFREKLGRLFRILAIAYFRMEERFDVTESGVRSASPSPNVSSTHESIVNVNSREETKELNVPITTSGETNDIAATSTSSTVPGNGKSFTERITFKSQPATIENTNISGTPANNIPNTGATLSRAGGPTTASDMRTATTTIDIATVLPVNTAMSKNYSNSDTPDLEILPITNRIHPTEAINDTYNSSAVFVPKLQVISTTTDFTSAPSTTNNFPPDYAVMNNFAVVESNVSKDDLVSRASTELSTVELNTLMEPMGTSGDSINGIPITTFPTTSNTSRIITYSDSIKSITADVKEVREKAGEGKESEGGTIKSTLINEITAKMSNRIEDKGVKRTNGRGDYPVPDDSFNSVDSKENGIGESSYPPVQYRNVTDRNSVESDNTTGLEISNIKMTTGQSVGASSGKTSGNAAAGWSESFNQSLPNPWTNRIFRVFEKAPEDFLNSTVLLPPNKIRKPALYEKVPEVSDFWKYMVIARNVTLATPTAKTFTLEADQEERTSGSSSRAKKRGSLNTDIEKNFRWFYNFGPDGKKHPSEKSIDRPSIRIECNEKQRSDGK